MRKLLQWRLDGTRLDNLLRRPVREPARWERHVDFAQPADWLADCDAVADILLADGMEERVRTADLEDSWQRNPIVRELLLRLGRHALTSLRPKLVIFDEFQRFRNLFTEGDSEAQVLMRRFLQAEADGAHVLFLSATPYKMLTLSGEDAEAGDHHADFLETIAVLYGAEGRNVVTGLREEMRHFRSHLRAFGAGLDPAAGPAKRAVEDRLRCVMSRTERVSTDTGDAGIRRRVLPVPVEENDLRQARAVHDVASRIGGNDRADYWKSAPYLFSFMNEYDLTRRLRAHPDRASFAVLGKGAMVPDDKRRRFEAIPAGNGRMRALMEEVLGQTDLHRRLWLPPALPYLAGGRGLTKTLIFSDWQMVPEAVAALVSYEAERKLRLEHGVTERPAKKYTAPLRLPTEKEASSTGMSTMLLLYPSAFLARTVDPLAIWRERGVISSAQMLDEAERRISAALADLALPSSGEESPWLLLAELDRQEPDWLGSVRRGLKSGSAKDDGGAALRCYNDIVATECDLSSTPASPTAIRLLARIALGSPATCLLRAFERSINLQRYELGFMAAQVAMGFRTMFNHREVEPLLVSGGNRSLAWSRVLDYCAEHDLQAVLDEYVFNVTGGAMGPGMEDGEPVHHAVARRLRETIGLRTAPITLHDPFTDEGRAPRRMASHLAARFSANATRDTGEEGGATGLRIDSLRDAFNSPFRPFVLASTSVGQEGLDFHPYCHRLWHWNLPGNPVDMEQREGRVQRYMNHAVRLNIAANHDSAAREADGAAWPAMLAAAEKEVTERGTSRRGLRPHWLYTGDAPNPVEIETVLPVPPLSRDAQRVGSLLRATAFYSPRFRAAGSRTCWRCSTPPTWMRRCGKNC
ncbi:hypothetical protein PE067_20895 [Paracoccus sp. DMF-8]|uniref:hypothetical protein n=1 Tax=Paracoccus sp. DMF-8 TaxID=3019445 RepID=UPI0023E3F128|nr:hypothetical protein [Paracoccus sp. DMF-8]MDF3608383.1 hypothetical protein [Paracoccus sp. DMF-8]